MANELTQALAGVWPPLAVAAPSLLATWRPWSTRRPDDAPAAGASLAVAGGFVAAFCVLKGIPALPPVRGEEWLVVAGAVAGVLGCFARRLTRAWTTAYVALALAAAASIAIRLIERKWTFFESIARVSVHGLLIAAVGIGLGALASRSRGPSLPLALVACGASASTVLMAGYSSSLAQLAGALAAIAAVTAAVAFWHGRVTVGLGGGFAFGLLLVGLLVCGHDFAGADPVHASVVAAAPLAAWIGRPDLGPSRWRGIVSLGAVVAVLVWPTVASVTAIAGREY